MKSLLRYLALPACIALALALVSHAQDPGRQAPGGAGGGGRPGPGAPGQGGPEGGRERRPPPPIMAALDTDGDGELSAAEIAQASQSLAKLDKNGDGKLTRDELRPTPPQGGPGGPGGPGGGQRPGGEKAPK